jgi:hypothetical protein
LAVMQAPKRKRDQRPKRIKEDEERIRTCRQKALSTKRSMLKTIPEKAQSNKSKDRKTDRYVGKIEPPSGNKAKVCSKKKTNADSPILKLRDRVLREETAKSSIAGETAGPSIERREKKVSRGRKKCKASRGQKERKASRGQKTRSASRPEGTKIRSKACQKAQRPEARHARRHKGQKQGIPEGQKAWSRPESRVASKGRKDHVDRKDDDLTKESIDTEKFQQLEQKRIPTRCRVSPGAKSHTENNPGDGKT